MTSFKVTKLHHLDLLIPLKSLAEMWAPATILFGMTQATEVWGRKSGSMTSSNGEQVKSATCQPRGNLFRWPTEISLLSLVGINTWWQGTRTWGSSVSAFHTWAARQMNLPGKIPVGPEARATVVMISWTIGLEEDSRMCKWHFGQRKPGWYFRPQKKLLVSGQKKIEKWPGHQGPFFYSGFRAW